MLALFVIYSVLSHWLWMLFFVDKTHSLFLMSPWRGTNLENHLGLSLSLSSFTSWEDFSNKSSLEEWTKNTCLKPFLSLLGTCRFANREFSCVSLFTEGECDRADSVPASWVCCFGKAGIMYYWRDGCISRSMWAHLSHVVQIGLSESKETLISLPNSSAYLSSDWRHDR